MKRVAGRMILGILLILAVNHILIEQGISQQVGVNVISLVTTGLLGIPGVAMLYGFVFFPIL